MSDLNLDWNGIENRFVELQTISALCVKQEDVPREEKPNFYLLKKYIKGELSQEDERKYFSVLSIPMLKLLQKLLMMNAHATSLIAKAASTPEAFVRRVGKYDIEVIEEEDAVFLVVRLNNQSTPNSLVVIGKNGFLHKIRLGESVNDMFQIGFHLTPDTINFFKMLKEPTTSVYLI